MGSTVCILIKMNMSTNKQHHAENHKTGWFINVRSFAGNRLSECNTYWMIVLLTDKLIPDSECYTTNKIWNEKANLMMNDRNEEKTEMVLIIPL